MSLWLTTLTSNIFSQSLSFLHKNFSRKYLETAKMEQPIDIRALEEAVVVFYRSNSAEQAAAHEWLTRVQCSRQAWSFVWDLMAPNKVSEISLIFSKKFTNRHNTVIRNTILRRFNSPF